MLLEGRVHIPFLQGGPDRRYLEGYTVGIGQSSAANFDQIAFTLGGVLFLLKEVKMSVTTEATVEPYDSVRLGTWTATSLNVTVRRFCIASVMATKWLSQDMPNVAGTRKQSCMQRSLNVKTESHD